MPTTEEIRRAKFKLAIDTLRGMISNDPNLPTHKVLAETVTFVTGEPYNTEVYRRPTGAKGNKEQAHARKIIRKAIKELEKFILEKELVDSEFQFTQNGTLQVIIDYFNAHLQ